MLHVGLCRCRMLIILLASATQVVCCDPDRLRGVLLNLYTNAGVFNLSASNRAVQLVLLVLQHVMWCVVHCSVTTVSLVSAAALLTSTSSRQGAFVVGCVPKMLTLCRVPALPLAVQPSSPNAGTSCCVCAV